MDSQHWLPPKLKDSERCDPARREMKISGVNDIINSNEQKISKFTSFWTIKLQKSVNIST